MKNLHCLSVATLMCVAFLTSCATKHGDLMKSAQVHYQTNDYEAALRDAVAALKLKPDYDKAQDFVVTFLMPRLKSVKTKLKALRQPPISLSMMGLLPNIRGLLRLTT